MGTLTDDDVRRPTQRTKLTAVDAADAFIVEDVTDNKLKYIEKSDLTDTLGINSNTTRIEFLESSIDAYGIEWDKDADEITRLNKAVGKSLTYTPDGGTTTITSDFDSISPWADMKRCNAEIVSGGKVQVNAYYGDASYAEDGSNGDVMVEIPKFYYRAYRDGNKYYWWVSPEPKPHFSIHPAFVRDDKILDYVYASAFEGCAYDVSASAYITDDSQTVDFDAGTGDKLASIANAQPLSGSSQSLNIINCRIIAENNDGHLQDFMIISAVQLLFAVEHATFDFQSTTEGINIGICGIDSGEGNHSQNTGHTSSLGNHSGWTTIAEVDLENGATGGDVYPNSYRGIENFFGNIWKWVDGINIIADYLVYIADHDFESNTDSDPYYYIGEVPDSNGYMGSPLLHPNADFGFLPLSIDGSSSSDDGCGDSGNGRH